MDKPTLPAIIYPRLSFEGKIHLIVSNLELAKVVPELLTASVLGFDTETRPSFKKGQLYKVALLQLATEDNAYLIRLHNISQFDGIKKIFENEATVKTGVAIRDDLKSLQKIFAFEPKSFIELQILAKEKALKNFGLKGMTEEVLNRTLNKGPKTTNWENYHLTDKQLLYAATDAWIGLKLYQAMTLMKGDKTT
jgi:ribonuclease D